MSASVVLAENRADEAEIARHLKRCDRDFVPPLSARVAIDDYAHKIAVNAVRFEAWGGNELIGLVAAYCNDLDRRVAFITSVSVQSEWQGQGLASRLMERCIGYVQARGFKGVELEVDKENVAAIKLYEKAGFSGNGAEGRFMRLFLDIERGV